MTQAPRLHCREHWLNRRCPTESACAVAKPRANDSFPFPFQRKGESLVVSGTDSDYSRGTLRVIWRRKQRYRVGVQGPPSRNRSSTKAHHYCLRSKILTSLSSAK